MSHHSILEFESYLYFWESYNRANTLLEFEGGYLQSYFQKMRGNTDVKLQMIETLKRFYRLHGVDARISYQESRLKIKKTILNHNNNIYEDFFAKLLNIRICDLVEGKADQIITKIPLDSLDEIYFECFGEDSLELIKAVDIYRSALRKVLRLEERDAVFVLENKIAIKYFKKVLDNPNERRFNGIEVEELERLSKKYSNVNYPHLLNRIAFNTITKQLDLKSTDNLTFHRNYIKLLQSQLQKAFQKHIPNELLLIGFTNYILRRHFLHALKVFATSIITLVGKNSENIKIFINFYDGKDIVIGTKKYTKPEIIVDNQRMSFYPIYTITTQHNALEQSYKSKCVEIEKIDAEIRKKEELKHSLEKKIKSDYDFLDSFEQDVNASARELRDLRIEYQRLQKELKTLTKKAQKEELEERINTIKEKIKRWSRNDSELLVKKNALSSELERNILKLEESKKDISALQTNIERENDKLNNINENLSELEKKMTAIKNGIINAILQFRI